MILQMFVLRAKSSLAQHSPEFMQVATLSANQVKMVMNVSSCVRVNPGQRVDEVVYPAQRDSRWSHAKCNKDGDFQFDISFPPNPSNVWQIEFQGGGFCFLDGSNSSAGCSNRNYGLISPATTRGIVPDRSTRTQPLSDDPDWGNAILVHAHYCSSDLWTGTNTTGIPIHYDGDNSTSNWPFTGKFNAQAMLDILSERYGLSDANNLLSIHVRGQSAGGWGVINNISDIKAKFPNIASRGNIMASAWSGYVPLTWDNPDYPVFGIVDPNTGPYTALDGFALATSIWQSSLYPACLTDHSNSPQDCISGDTMYSYITAPENDGHGGMDIPLLVFQNAQDQVYMSQDGIPQQLPRQNTSSADARSEFEQDMSTAMGVDFQVPNISSKIKWLYAVNDPQVTNINGKTEPNVHPPLCYQYNSPDGAENSLDQVTRRFWNTRGQGPGRGQLSGEVHTFNVNYVRAPICP